MSPLASETPTRNPWSSAKERVAIQLVHWLVVVIVVFATTLLAFRHDIDSASVTALFGTVLGHVGTVTSQKMSSRGDDGGRS